jgi:4-hydroxy-L-threonine phosphate dehydrogenase PdxA
MRTPFSSSRFIAITTGDQDGIGFEITAKAINRIGISLKKNNIIFFIFRHRSQEKVQPEYFKLLDKRCTRYTFNSLDESLSFMRALGSKSQVPDNIVIDLSLSTTPADWVYEAAMACKLKKLHSLVTGPLSKKTSIKLYKKPLGHTGIFRQIFPKIHMSMVFVGRDFNVLLATDHISLSSVESSLKAGDFKNSLVNAINFKKLFKLKSKIAVLGLNPHAGEGGIIGKTEATLFKKINKRVFDGPLVPDAAFLKKNWKRYGLFVCLYHDQGLIPFKSHHGQDSGVHITIGLPFLRTSVDHGTANEIFNKDMANANSMIEAINLNLKLTGVKNV